MNDYLLILFIYFLCDVRGGTDTSPCLLTTPPYRCGSEQPHCFCSLPNMGKSQQSITSIRKLIPKVCHGGHKQRAKYNVFCLGSTVAPELRVKNENHLKHTLWFVNSLKQLRANSFPVLFHCYINIFYIYFSPILSVPSQHSNSCFPQQHHW